MKTIEASRLEAEMFPEAPGNVVLRNMTGHGQPEDVCLRRQAPDQVPSDTNSSYVGEKSYVNDADLRVRPIDQEPSRRHVVHQNEKVVCAREDPGEVEGLRVELHADECTELRFGPSQHAQFRPPEGLVDGKEELSFFREAYRGWSHRRASVARAYRVILPSVSNTFEDLRAIVVDNPRLRRRLLSVPDRPSFIHEVVAIAHEHGYELSTDEVDAAFRAARRQSLDRWV